MGIHPLLQLTAKLLWNLKSKLFYAVLLLTENPEQTIWYTPKLLYLHSFCICFLCPVHKVFHLLLNPMLCFIMNEAFLWMESIWTPSSLGFRGFLGCLDCVQKYAQSCVRGIESDSLATSSSKTKETTIYCKASENPQVASNVSKLLKTSFSHYYNSPAAMCSYVIFHGSNVVTALL